MGADEPIDSRVASIVIIAQLDRLCAPYARQPDGDLWNDDPDRLAILYKPLCVDVKPETLIVLSDILQITSAGYFSTSGCSDSAYISNMYIVVACLRILKSHLYQLVRAKLPQSECNISRTSIDKIRSQIFAFLETASAPRGGSLFETTRVVSSVVQSEAAQILAEAFEFFYAAVSDQVSYLGKLIKKFNTAKSGNISNPVDILSQPEQDLLELLLSRFASFSSGSLLMDELEQSAREDRDSSPILIDVLFNLILASVNEVTSSLSSSGKSLAESNILGILQNFQKHLLSRAGIYANLTSESEESVLDETVTGASINSSVLSSRAASSGVMNITASKSKTAPDNATHAHVRKVIFFVVREYAKYVIESSSDVIRLSADIIAHDRTSEGLRRVGEDILRQSIVGKLTRPLVTALYLFSTADNPEHSVKLLPVLSRIAIESNRLCMIVKDVSHPEEEMAVDKICTVQSKHPYRNNVDREESVVIKGAETLTVQFDKALCSTQNPEDFVQLFRCTGKKDALTERLHGPADGSNWPSEPIVVQGDTLFVHFHTGTAGCNWGFRLNVTGTILVKPLSWLEDFTKTITWLCGKMGSALIVGPPVGPAEHELCSSWSVLFSAGIEKSHPAYPCISPVLTSLGHSFEDDIASTSPLDESMTAASVPMETGESGISENYILRNRSTVGEDMGPGSLGQQYAFLQNLINGKEEGRKLIENLNHFVPDRHIVQRSVSDHAQAASRGVLAVFLKLTNRVQLAFDAAIDESGARPSDALLRLWKKSLEMKLELRSLKAQGEDTEDFLRVVMQRVHFMLHVQAEDLNVYTEPVPGAKVDAKPSESRALDAAVAGSGTQPLPEQEQQDANNDAVMTDSDTGKGPGMAQPLHMGENSNSSMQTISAGPAAAAVAQLLDHNKNVDSDMDRWTQAHVMTKLLKNTMKALRRLKDLMLVRTRLASVKQDPESVLLRTVIKLMLTKNLELDVLVEGMMAQRSRGLMRLIGLRHFTALVRQLKRPELLPQLLLHLAAAFHRDIPSDSVPLQATAPPPQSSIPSSSTSTDNEAGNNGGIGNPVSSPAVDTPDSGSSTTSSSSQRGTKNRNRTKFVKRHFASDLVAVGHSLTNRLSHSYFQIISEVISLDSLDDSSLLHLLNLCNMQFTAKDMRMLKEVGFFRMLEPLISFCGTNRALLKDAAACDDLRKTGSMRRRPWNIRYSAWAVFRLLAYCASSHGNSSTSLEPLLQTAYLQTSRLWSMRCFEAAGSRTVGTAGGRAPSLSGELKGGQEIETLLNVDQAQDSDANVVEERREPWSCVQCTFFNEGSSICAVCELSFSEHEQIFQNEQSHDTGDSKAMLFSFEHDFDTNGVMYYLGTNLGVDTWRNPADIGRVRVTSSSLQVC